MPSLGRTEIELSPVIMGLWQAGGQYWAGIDDQESIHAIHAALDAGIHTFDTAEAYGDGHSERVLGRALAGRREQAIILSKVFSNHMKYAEVIAACERSLKNLASDYLDLFQIHWPSGSWNSESVPIEETMDALQELLRQGKIRAIGASNFSRDHLEAVAGCGRIESLQPPYSLFWRHIEQDITPWCQANEVSILAYSPLAQGILADRFGPEPVFEKGDHRRANKLFLPDHYPRVLAALDRLRPIAAEHRLSLAQLALAWVMAQPRTHAIAGARNRDQVRQNALAMKVVLAPEVLEELGRIGDEVAAPLRSDSVPWTWQP